MRICNHLGESGLRCTLPPDHRGAHRYTTVVREAPATTERTPISVDDIREGDLIRLEKVGDRYSALEYRAGRDGDVGGVYMDVLGYYLLDRPAPKVDLPTELSFGRLTWYAGEESSGLGVHESGVGFFIPKMGGGLTDSHGNFWAVDSIVLWEPMTAVLTVALDELRDKHDRYLSSQGCNYVDDFLTAIDKAVQS